RVALAELVNVHPAGSPDPLRAAFERGPADVRAEALVRALDTNVASTPAFEPALGKALDDEDADVRRIAFVMSVVAAPELQAWLDGRDEEHGRALADVLKRAIALTSHGDPPAQAPGGTTEPDLYLMGAAKKRLVKAASVPALLSESARG